MSVGDLNQNMVTKYLYSASATVSVHFFLASTSLFAPVGPLDLIYLLCAETITSDNSRSTKKVAFLLKLIDLHVIFSFDLAIRWACMFACVSVSPVLLWWSASCPLNWKRLNPLWPSVHLRTNIKIRSFPCIIQLRWLYKRTTYNFEQECGKSLL